MGKDEEPVARRLDGSCRGQVQRFGFDDLDLCPKDVDPGLRFARIGKSHSGVDEILGDGMTLREHLRFAGDHVHIGSRSMRSRETACHCQATDHGDSGTGVLDHEAGSLEQAG